MDGLKWVIVLTIGLCSNQRTSAMDPVPLAGAGFFRLTGAR